MATSTASDRAAPPRGLIRTHSPETLDAVLDRIARSPFRAKFDLSSDDVAYARRRGRGEIFAHAARFVGERLSAANPDNDGRQTPMRGHPVFRAQHATATCCRGCLAKHHGIVEHHPLTAEQQGYVVAVIVRWIERQLTANARGRPPTARGSTSTTRALRAGDLAPTLF